MSLYAAIMTEDGRWGAPPELDPKRAGLVHGQMLPHVWGELERIAARLGTTPLGAFVHRDAELFEETGEEPPEPREWRDAAEIHKTASALLRFFREADSARLGGFGFSDDDREAIVWNLSAFEAILRSAAERGVRARIEIG